MVVRYVRGGTFPVIVPAVDRSLTLARGTHSLRGAFLAATLGAVVLASGFIAAQSSFYYQTADFFCLWQGGRFVVLGLDPYDEAAWDAATGGLYPDPRGGTAPASCPGRFAYPYWTAITLVPFGVLPLEVAASLWEALAIGAALAGALLAWRAADGPRSTAPLFLALVLFSQPFWTLLVSGQITGVMLALVSALSWSFARRRDVAAGVALAGLALKPQIGLLVAPLVVLRAVAERRGTFLAVALAVGGTLALASFALAPQWADAWLGEISTRRLGSVALRPSVWGFAQETFGNALWGVVLLIAVVVAIGAVARRNALAAVPLVALAAALSLVATPYISSYDHLVLVLPWALALALAARATGRARLGLLVGLVAAASLLPWVLFAVPVRGGSPTWSVAVPVAAALVLAVALRLTSRRPLER